MNMRRFVISITIVCIGLGLLLGGFFWINNYIYQEKQGESIPTKSYRAALEGTYVCLMTSDSTSPDEQECEPGIRTDTSEEYAVNFFLMSQMHAPLEVGQRFSANGVISTDKSTYPPALDSVDIEGVFSVTDSLMILGDEDEPYACDADAKLCSDGSYVGRQGPECEFAACPSPVTLPAEVTVSLGDTTTVTNLTISPHEVVSDSRCPADVECVWAGTVEVRTTLSTQVAHGEHVLTLDESQVFGEYLVTLVDVLPAKIDGQEIPSASYKFVYTVTTN